MAKSAALFAIPLSGTKKRELSLSMVDGQTRHYEKEILYKYKQFEQRRDKNKRYNVTNRRDQIKLPRKINVSVNSS